MEKRRKNEQSLWITPGVFAGSAEIEEAVGKINTVTQADFAVPSDVKPTLKEQIEELTVQLVQMQQLLASWEDRIRQMEEENRKEWQYLYQVVLSLKKEWEKERNEHRHH